MTNPAPHPSSAAAADGPAECPYCAGETDDERQAHYKRVLRRLTEIGMNAAEALERKIVAEADRAEQITAKMAAGEIASDRPEAAPDAKPVADYTLALTRVSRCVRLTLMLEDKLIETFRARAKADAAEAAERSEAARKTNVRRKRAEVGRILREAIRAEAGDQSEYDHLARLVDKLLRHPEVQDELGTLSIEEAVVRLCRELEINPDWTRWAGEAWRNGEEPPEEPPPARRHCPACCPVCNAEAPTADPPPPAGGSGSDPP